MISTPQLSAPISAQISGGRRHLVFVLLLVSYFFAYFFRVSASVVLPDLQTAWGLSATMVGFISSMYFYAYAVMQPFCGVLNDRFGPMRIVGAGMAITCAGSALFGLADSPTLLIAGRILQGIGVAPMLSGLFVYQGASYAPRLYTFLSGITLTVGNLGAVVSVYPLSTAMNAWGREEVFSALAVFILMISACLFLASFSKNSVPAEVDARPAPPMQGTLWGQIREAFVIIVSSPNLTRLTLIWALHVGTSLTLQGLWAVAWFKSVYAVGDSSASMAAMMFGIGVMAGNMLSSRIRIPGKRHLVVKGCAYAITASWILMLLSFAFTLPMLVTAVIMTMIGFTGGIGLVQFVAAQNAITPAGRSGGIFGIINTLNFAVTIVFQWGSGAIISLVAAMKGAETTSDAFLIAHVVVALGMVLACCIARRITSFD